MTTQDNKIQNRWKKALFLFWIYTLIVILWGAWVRISHSGDGCGNHWPLCGGEFIPTEGLHKTWIEYTHRLMSGSYGLIVIYIFFKIKKIKSFSSWSKKLSIALLILMITEALLGAILVKGQLVTVNDSFTRLLVMSFHQLNSFILTGVTYLLYRSFVEDSIEQNRNFQPFILLKKHKWLLVAFLLLPITGAIAALSSTLFPTISVLQGILDDFSQNSHLFIRLRVLHPLLALSIASGFMIWCFMQNRQRLAFEFLGALLIGVITLATLSPVYLKLSHLLIAHWLWARVLQLCVSLPDSSKR